MQALAEVARILEMRSARTVFMSPAVPATQKAAALDRMLPNAAPLIRNFLHILIDRDRLDEVPEILEARMRTGLSQQKFADVLGVSTRTLQGWEQGRRKPSGAARSLLTIAKRRPEVLRELFAE